MPGWAALLPEDPRTAGPYQVVGRLGSGGQGTVYAGTAPDGARVAIKVLHSHLSLDERARTRFLGEVEAAKLVARFCTVQVIGSGLLGHRPYIVSEYVDGPSLQDAVAAHGPRSGAAMDRLAISTATALAAIHRAGIVHRDFKPGNVLLAPDGPVVIDFGIARALTANLSTTSQVVGSPAYMAPEQISGTSIGPPADMFAWAVTMVYAAGAVKAFTGESIPAIMQSILHDEPELGALTGQLRGVARQCLAKDPAERPTAEEVAATLLDQTTPTVKPLAAPQPGPAPQPVPEPEQPKSTQPEPVKTPGDAVPAETMPGQARRWNRSMVVGAVAGVALLALCGAVATDFATSRGRARTHLTEPRPAMRSGTLAAPSGKLTAAPPGQSKTPAPGHSSPTTPDPSGNGPTPGQSKPTRKPRTPPKTSKKPSRPGTPIGTMPYSVLDPYCTAHGYASAATLANGPYCVTKDNKFVPINMNSVCRYKFPAYPNAVLQSYNTVGGHWTCLSS